MASSPTDVFATRSLSVTSNDSANGRRASVLQRVDSAGEPPVKFVRVAVVPPRLPPGMAPPTGVGAADTFGWDESVNWTHNLPPLTPEEEEKIAKRKKSILKSTFISPKERARSSTKIPFTTRQVPYDEWRKHYAKDADGNYKGTGTPAEDCLLLPHDVERWRLGPVKTRADLYSRGKEALPSYSDHAETSIALPSYTEENIFNEPPQGQTNEPDDSSPQPQKNPPPPGEQSPTDAAPDYTPRQDELARSTRPARGSDPQRTELRLQQQEPFEMATKAAKFGWKAKIQKGLENVSMGA